MATQLSIYNGALREIGERKLATLSDNTESRRLLDGVWNGTEFIRYVLGQGLWKFAKRTKQIFPETGLEADFGYRKAFAKPTDFVRTIALTSDEHLNQPLTTYTEEKGHWFTDIEPIYVAYVSDDVAGYGGDLSVWDEEFVLYVETFLASRIVKRVTQSDTDYDKLHKLAKARLLDARSSNAMEGPTEFPPTGSWVRSRLGSRGGRRDRGNRGGLIG